MRKLLLVFALLCASAEAQIPMGGITVAPSGGAGTTVTYASQYSAGSGNTSNFTPGTVPTAGNAVVVGYWGSTTLTMGTLCDGTGSPSYCTGSSSYNISAITANSTNFASFVGYTCNAAGSAVFVQAQPSAGTLSYSAGIVGTGNTTTSTGCNDATATVNVVTTNTTSYTTNSVTTTNAHDLLVAVFINSAGGTCTAGTDGQGNTMTLRSDGNGAGVVCVETFNETTTGTYTATLTGPSAKYTAYLMALK